MGKLRRKDDAVLLLQEVPALLKSFVPGSSHYVEPEGRAALSVPRGLGSAFKATYCDDGLSAALFETGLLLISAYLPDSWKPLTAFEDAVLRLGSMIDLAARKAPNPKLIISGI